MHSGHAHLHAEIRRVATELRPLLRAPSVPPDFSGKLHSRVRQARVLLRSEGCAEALDELRDLKALVEGSILERGRRSSFDDSTSSRKGARPIGVKEPQREPCAIRLGSGIFRRTPRQAARIAACALATLMVSVAIVVLVPTASAETVVATITVGSVPFGVGVNDVTNKVYVANFGPAGSGHTVSVVDGSTNTVEATVGVGSGPRRIGVNEITNRIYVANSGSNNVSVIDGTTNTVVATTRYP